MSGDLIFGDFILNVGWGMTYNEPWMTYIGTGMTYIDSGMTYIVFFDFPFLLNCVVYSFIIFVWDL